jgi:anti-anti-sigma regulatory factor
MGPRTIPFPADNATVGSTMKIHRDDSATDHVVVVSGAVASTDAARLEACLVLAASDGEADVLLDARGVTAFDDLANSALTATRSRARSRHHRVAVLDRPGGAVSASLQRTGRQFRFPVYADASAAELAMAADRQALARTGATRRPGRDAEGGPLHR